MAIYLLYVASPIAAYLFMKLWNERTNERTKYTVKWNSKVYLVVCGIIMCAMIGLRSQLNGSDDTYRYSQYWTTIQQASWSELGDVIDSIDMEKGYLFVVFLLTRVFENPQWQLLLSGAFFAITICYFVKKSCNGSPLALLVFNCLGLFNFMVQGLRQAIAMCICLWALEQIKNKHYMKSIILIFLAAMFHGSACFFFVVIVLSKFKLNYKGLIAFITSVVLTIKFMPDIFEIMGTILNDDYTSNAAAEDGGIVAILIYAVIILFGLIFADKKEEHFSLYIYMVMVGMFCMIMRNSLAMFAERVSHYFAFGQMAVLSNSTKNVSDQKTKTIVQIVAVALMIAVAAYKASYSTLIPYNFFWQE